MLDANATLIHKDFAKSKGWQTVIFCLGVFGVLVVALLTIGSLAWGFVQITIGTMIALFGVAAGIDMKKFNKLLKQEKKDD